MRVSLPTMECTPGCGDCCGVVICHPHEYAAVNAYAKEHGITPKDQGITCPWYQEGTCAVYPVRPFVCQMFGHSKSLVCPHGFNTNIPEKLERRYTKQYGEPTKFLHDVIPGALDRLLEYFKKERRQRHGQA